MVEKAKVKTNRREKSKTEEKNSQLLLLMNQLLMMKTRKNMRYLVKLQKQS